MDSQLPQSINPAMINNSPAPVAAFVYNRLNHTQQTFSALAANECASQTTVYVFSDAAKSPEFDLSVQEVRAYIKTLVGFHKVVLIEQIENQGLARSITQGIEFVLRTHDRIIVLEDDIVTSKYFLRFMNDALVHYADHKKVMHISGCTYPIEDLDLNGQDTYFLRVPLCWGWATWRDRWSLFERNVNILSKFNRKMISDIDFDSTTYFWKQMRQNASGAISTWFIFWYATLYLHNGIALFPRKSLVNNIGHDGTGVHCSSTADYAVDMHDEPILVKGIELNESKIAFESHKTYFRSLRKPFHTKVLNRLRGIFTFTRI